MTYISNNFLLIAGLLAFLTKCVANISGRVLQAVFIGVAVFIIGI